MCGFIGLVGVERVASSLFMGLQAIQHRGQDAAGVGVYRGGHVTVYKDVGRVPEVLTEGVLERLPGAAGIGHVRYPTVGLSTRTDAQPFMSRRPSVVLAHNGQITNLVALETHLLRRGIHMMSGCDSEPIMLILGDELLRDKVARFEAEDLFLAIGRTMDHLEGSYSVAAVLEIDGRETLAAFRDPHGLRPAVYGRRADGAWAVASESVSLDVLDFQVVGHVPPGSAVLMRKGEEPVIRALRQAPTTHCIFEDIYFARPDSVLDAGRVYAHRRRLGEQLATEWARKGHEVDVVVAVPDTSRPAAQAMAELLGVAYREGFIKNRYSGRTFIMPDQASREAAMRLKLNPIREIFEGKRVVIVDDSIVRGTTMRRIVRMVRGMNPTSLHVTIFSPAVRHPCFYGIDMPTKKELVASDLSTEETEARLAERFGCDSVTFLSDEGLRQVSGERICAACFTGDYPILVNEEERRFLSKERVSPEEASHA